MNRDAIESNVSSVMYKANDFKEAAHNLLSVFDLDEAYKNFKLIKYNDQLYQKRKKMIEDLYKEYFEQ